METSQLFFVAEFLDGSNNYCERKRGLTECYTWCKDSLPCNPPEKTNKLELGGLPPLSKEREEEISQITITWCVYNHMDDENNLQNSFMNFKSNVMQIKHTHDEFIINSSLLRRFRQSRSDTCPSNPQGI